MRITGNEASDALEFLRQTSPEATASPDSPLWAAFQLGVSLGALKHNCVGGKPQGLTVRYADLALHQKLARRLDWVLCFEPHESPRNPNHHTSCWLCPVEESAILLSWEGGALCVSLATSSNSEQAAEIGELLESASAALPGATLKAVPLGGGVRWGFDGSTFPWIWLANMVGEGWTLEELSRCPEVHSWECTVLTLEGGGIIREVALGDVVSGRQVAAIGDSIAGSGWRAVAHRWEPFAPHGAPSARLLSGLDRAGGMYAGLPPEEVLQVLLKAARA